MAVTNVVYRQSTIERQFRTLRSSIVVNDFSQHMSPTEALVAAAFQDLLEVPVITASSDFFELGGDSYMAVNLAVMLEGRFRIPLPVELLEEATTVAQMAAWIERKLALQ